MKQKKIRTKTNFRNRSDLKEKKSNALDFIPAWAVGINVILFLWCLKLENKKIVAAKRAEEAPGKQTYIDF